MAARFIRDLSASTSQMLINYLSGIIVFYILSLELIKTEFGELNWTLAITLTAFNILGFGIDNVSIRKIAAGEDRKEIVSTYLWHVMISGLFLFMMVFIFRVLFPSFFEIHYLLIILVLARVIIFLSQPFKHLAAGLGEFRTVMWMSIASNLTRCLALLLLLLTKNVNLGAVVLIFLASAGLELLICIVLAGKKYGARILPYKHLKHLALIKESLPQWGVVIFDSAIARFDWIFIGLLASPLILANYSFAYKVFEVCLLPLMIIGPLLIPRFTRLLHSGQAMPANRESEIWRLLRIEMIISCGIAMVLTLAWSPLVDALTGERYGNVNFETVFLLCLCMPLLYLNNFFWTLHFARGALRLIFIISALAFAINITGNILLIPVMKAEGAALAFTISIFLQSVLYWTTTTFIETRQALYSWLVCFLSAVASGFASFYFLDNSLLATVISLVFYTGLLVMARQIRREDIVTLKGLLRGSATRTAEAPNNLPKATE